MVVNWDGTLFSTEFYDPASSFSELWREFKSSLPHWSWVPSPKRPWISHNQNGYLSMENVILPSLSKEDNRESDQIEIEECSCVDDVELIDTAATLAQSYDGEHRYNFHIIYSSSYKVPVLYFRAYSCDGQPLVLEDIENDISVNSLEILNRSKWSFITQEEHPYLNRPWQKLHPSGRRSRRSGASGKVCGFMVLSSWAGI